MCAVKRAGLLADYPADPLHGRGGRPGAKVGNGVAVGGGVAVAAGPCACAAAKKATKPTRTHTLRKAIPDRNAINLANVFIDEIQSHCVHRKARLSRFFKIALVLVRLDHVARGIVNSDHGMVAVSDEGLHKN